MTEIAVLAGGCFWCTESIFQRLRGVVSVTSGYTGGDIPNPTYEQVCSGSTGHAEAIKIEFNSRQISYKSLLEIFFATHDSTTLNRQGSDVGTQYRSEIFYTTQLQKNQAESYINTIPNCVTKVSPLDIFYPAENYHQNYFNNHPNAPYCSVVINPKIKKLLTNFPKYLEKLN